MREPLRLPPAPPAPEAGAPVEAPRPDAPGGGAGRRVRSLAPFGRPSEEQREAMLRHVDGIGLHLICPEPRCRRAKRCRDPNRTQLPFCFWLHRGTCRFVLACIAARGENAETADDREARPGPARRTGRTGRSGRTGRTGESLLAKLQRAGWPIERLARTREDGADDWSWETEPEACAQVEAFKGRKGKGQP